MFQEEVQHKDITIEKSDQEMRNQLLEHRPQTITNPTNLEKAMGAINEILYPLSRDTMDLIEPFFQQDGATCHTTRFNMEVLRNRFPGKLLETSNSLQDPQIYPHLIFSCGDT